MRRPAVFAMLRNAFRRPPPKPRARPRMSSSAPVMQVRQRGISPAEYRLPAHETVRLPMPATPTQELPVVQPFTEGRDLLTGRPRLFGNPFLAVLSGVGDAMSVRGVVGAFA